MEQYFERNYVYNKMKNVVDKFFKENYSEMGGFELGVLSISSKVTNSIINKVVSEINKNITENKNKASVIRKESEQLYASAVADTNVIMNNALNEGKVMVQNASAKGFELEQESQRIGLSLLEQKLNLSKNNLIHYSWLRDIKNILGSDSKEKLLSDFKKNFLRDLIISKK